MIKAVDMLAEFEQFREEILPALRKDLQEGKDTKEIIKKYKAIAAAKVVSSMFAPTNPLQLAAAKDILDRGDGKAKESKDVRHKFEDVSDTDLKALLRTRLAEASEPADEE